MSIQDLQYDKYSLIINGKRHFIRSGAMHYFRLPSQELWKDRLYKLKVAGYNTVDLYFNWGFHSECEGEYDFTGIRDIQALLQLTKEMGLWVIARPGPYINAEVSGGGFPMWLLAKKNIPLRNRLNGAFAWSDDYMAYVGQWWKQIIPIINAFDNVLMLQIENEYSTLEVEPDYMQALYKLSKDLGVKVPLSHNDLFIAGLYQDVVDLYAFDNYSVTQFETDWRKMSGIFSVLDQIETNLRPFCQNRPLIAAELQAGWFGTWKGVSYQDITGSLGREHINVSTKTVIAQGLTIFNHYKAIGGTNWGHIGSTETYTSYDFGAPISEVGLNTIRLYEAKSLNYLAETFDLSATEKEEDSTQWPFQISTSGPLYAVRKNVKFSTDQANDSANGWWLFFRNLEEKTATSELSVLPGYPIQIEVHPHEMLALPVATSLANGWKMLFTSVEPLYQDTQRLVLRGSHTVNLAFQHTHNLNGEILEGTMEFKRIDHATVSLHCPALSGQQKVQFRLNDGQQELSVIILSQFLSDRFWQDKTLLGDTLWVGPDAMLCDGSFAVHEPAQAVYRIDDKGKLEQLNMACPQHIPELPALSAWSLFDGSPELTQDDLKSYRPVSATGLDLDSNQQYEGSAWYRVSLGSYQPRQITLDATHIWMMFLNGARLAHGAHLPLIHEETDNPIITIDVPASMLNAENNTLHIFVDSLGHPKGFHDDEQEVQGLIQLSIDGIALSASSDFPVDFSGGLANERNDQKERNGNKKTSLKTIDENARLTPPLLYAETDFELPDFSQCEQPLGLAITGLDCERVNIYINGVLIGRHWEACKAQDMFYLPPGLLNMEAGQSNRVGLLCMQFHRSESVETLSRQLFSPNTVRLIHFDRLYKCFPGNA